MPENKDKIGKFVQAVTDHAAAQSRQVHREVEAYKRARLAEVEKKALAESSDMIKREQAALQKEIRLEMSRRELTARRQLLEKRREMTEKIFEEAKVKLIDFTESDVYPAFLAASFEAIASEIPADGTVYYASERDKKREIILQKFLPDGAKLEFVKDIQIGGIRAYHAPSGLMPDDTLDTRLEQQREWFAASSGLTME